MIPDYLKVAAAELGKGQAVKVRIKGGQTQMAEDLAEAMFAEIKAGEISGRGGTLIIPVGPVDHYPILAKLLNENRLSCKNCVFINMDEYLTDTDEWLPIEHPLSFRGYMERMFYGLLDPRLA